MTHSDSGAAPGTAAAPSVSGGVGSGGAGGGPAGSRTSLLLAVAFTLVTWASAFAAIRHAVHAFPPASLALTRFLVASIVLAAVAWW